MSNFLPAYEFDPAAETQLFSPEDISALLIASFRFSRGSSGSQDTILRYLARSHSAKFTAESFDQAIDMTVERALKIYTSEQTHPPIGGSDVVPIDEVKDQILIYADSFQHCAYIAKNDDRAKADVVEITEGLIDADFKWLPYQRARDKKRISSKPFRANIVHFGLLGRPTGRPEYDEIFCTVTNNLLNQFYRGSKFTAIVEQHIQHQPQDLAAVELALFSQPRYPV